VLFDATASAEVELCWMLADSVVHLASLRYVQEALLESLPPGVSWFDLITCETELRSSVPGCSDVSMVSGCV
jgi:hypothetical protein